MQVPWVLYLSSHNKHRVPQSDVSCHGTFSCDVLVPSLDVWINKQFFVSALGWLVMCLINYLQLVILLQNNDDLHKREDRYPLLGDAGPEKVSIPCKWWTHKGLHLQSRYPLLGKGGPDGVRDLQRMDRLVFCPIIVFCCCCLDVIIIFSICCKCIPS